jgi:ERCC4-related helicase
MPALTEHDWRLKYTPDDGDLVEQFYVPALRCAIRYDRATGYFGAAALALAMRGIESLVRNQGHMRLIVGCTLNETEVAAIEKGGALRDTVQRHLASQPLAPPDDAARDALELLAWMIAQGHLEVKVAVPCDSQRRPMSADGIFHEKAGIIEDSSGNRLAFNGSINETYAGWKKNWESFNVFTSWTGTAAHAALEDANFAKLWTNNAKHALTLDVPAAVRGDLMRFLPESDLPARLIPPPGDEASAGKLAATGPHSPNGNQTTEGERVRQDGDLRRQVWAYIRHAPSMPNGGERVGEATCAVDPWPHQIRAFQRLYALDAPRLLIADEVGLGKTIQAGMLLRQMWLTRRARRILVLTPAAVMRQWQLELREKFNLNLPVYDDGRLTWCLSPSTREAKSDEPKSRDVTRADWHHEPIVIASSHLMRRNDRQNELCEDAEPWDLVILDEAHHARRKGAGSAKDEGPNALLRLMHRLRERTQGLVLLTATPMQVHPVELWDLLALLGLPAAWGAGAFLRFFDLLGKPAPSYAELDELSGMFRAAEHAYGQATAESLARLGVTSQLRVRRILDALRDTETSIPRRRLGAEDRSVALGLMRASTPVSHLVSRHTRDLLRQYFKKGKISTPIAERAVSDVFITMTTGERAVYDAVEDYISTTYNQASSSERNAVGFVMTVYRRRLASSFRALRYTLEGRLAPLTQEAPAARTLAMTDDASDDESRDDVMDADEAATLEKQALRLEERHDIERLLKTVAALPVDTKARRLYDVLEELRAVGYKQAMVFTQFTDTMDFLRSYLASRGLDSILCFSGRGGEVLGTDGRWRVVSRDEVKRRFREHRAEILLCTDAAAEGLNFQFCGALVNYDMPWNPMRVEQRIGRIDRVGQEHAIVRIVNLHYNDTVEADVYAALRERIGLFESVVGRLQPILSQLPRTISDTVLRGRVTDEVRARVASDVASRADALTQDQTALDLDLLAVETLDFPQRPAPTLDLAALDNVIARGTELLPSGVTVRKLQPREYGYLAPGMPAEVRVTTDSDYFEQHSESVELWSPGSPLFPDAAELAAGERDNSGALNLADLL